MYHSITFGEKNTWDDWHLITPVRPFFTPPKPRTNFIEVPGSNESLDFSTALTGYPTYDNREGTFDFIVMNDYKSWVDSYGDIMEYLHGKRMRAYLEDDPDFFYEGRFEVSEWSSTHPWSSISISYEVDPFKWSFKTSTDGWLWDPFVFATDTTWVSPFDNFRIDSDTWVQKNFLKSDFGSAPVCPTFIAHSSDKKGFDVKYKNLDMGITREEHLKDGSSYFPGFIFYGYSNYELYFKGHGKISMDFRYGRL